VRKHNAGTVKETVIADAINNAELDLHGEGVLVYKTKKYLHEMMRPFVVTENVTFTSGIHTPTASIKSLMDLQIIDGSDKWPAKIVQDPASFRVGSLEDVTDTREGTDIPIALYIKELAISAAETNLPQYFVKPLGGFTTISGEDFKAIQIEAENWGSKDAKRILGDINNPDELNHLNIVEAEIIPGSWTNGRTAMPSDMVQLLSVTSIVGTERYAGIVVKSDKLDSRNIADMRNDGEIKKQLVLTKKTIALTSGVGDLPENYILDKQMFQSGDNEGLILDSTEFLDRSKNVILPPEEEYPIARIYGDKIEVLPSTISSIDLYAYEFPTEKQPVVAAIGDELAIEPRVPTGNLIIRYIAHPVAKRPVFKIHDAKITVDPAPADFTLTYLEYPTEKAALVRHVSDDIEIKPETITNAEITYFKDITPAVYALAARGDGKGYEFDLGNSTDTEFTLDAVPYLVAQACKYLGVPYKDPGATSFGDIQKK
jgi:hypothetical protein